MKPLKPLVSGTVMFIAVACNQNLYDHIYRQIIQQTLREPSSSHATFDVRNSAIENLRALSQGQLSSYEKSSIPNNDINPRWN